MFESILRRFFRRKERSIEMEQLKAFLVEKQLNSVETDMIRIGRMLAKTKKQMFKTFKKIFAQRSAPEDKICLIVSSILSALQMFMELVPPSERRDILKTLEQTTLKKDDNHQHMYG